MDAERVLEQRAGRRRPVETVREAAREAGDARQAVGIGEHPLPQRDALPAGALGLPAVDELGEVERERVPVARRVGAVDLAQLALEAVVHHPGGLARGERAGVAAMILIGAREQPGEAVAVLEAEAAPGADVEHAFDLLAEGSLVPVPRLLRVDAPPVGRREGRRGRHSLPCVVRPRARP